MLQLSQAIRRGAMKRPQVRYELFALTPDGILGSCALGAAYEAAGVMAAQPGAMAFDLSLLSLPLEWTPLFNSGTRRACPAGHLFVFSGMNIPQVIAHLNNEHKWTRERIADWVETIENELLPPNHQQELPRHEQAEELSELVCA